MFTTAADDTLRFPNDARQGVWQMVCALAAIAAIGLLIYSNSFGAPFIYDGVLFVMNNKTVKSLSFWTYELGGNRPIGFLSFALNYAVGRFDVWGYHAVNVAIHVAAAWALYGLVRITLAGPRLIGRYGGAAHGLALAVALVWLVHPLQTQSVTYIYQRLEALMSLFYLLTLYTFARAQSSTRPDAWYALSVACCVLGMSTKEVMVTAPLAVVWYDRVFIANSWRELVDRRMSYYCYLGSSWIILAFLMLTRGDAYAAGGVFFVPEVSHWQYAASQPGIILHYLALSFWPAALCLDYAWPVAQTTGEIVPPLVALAVILLLTVWAMLRRPAIGFVAGMFFLVLAPTSSIAPIKDLAFEHRMYLPLASVVILTVLAAYRIWQWGTSSLTRPPSFLTGAVPVLAVVAVVAALGYRTYVRNRDYETTLSIWQDVARTRPTNRMAFYNIGTDWVENGRPDEALPALDKALELKPVLGQGQLDLQIHVNRGRALLQLGRYQDAIKDFDRAVEIRSAVPMAYLCRGQCYEHLKQYEPAIMDYSRAIEIFPGDPETIFFRGRTCEANGEIEAAIVDYSRAIELQPDYVEAILNRARCYFTQKQYDLAWGDVRVARKYGARPDADFLRKLTKASGRRE